MESDSSELLRDAERAEAAPFVDYPPTPWWYPPLAGLWFGAVAATMSGFYDPRADAIKVAALFGAALLLFGLLGVFVGWYRRRWGSWPAMRKAPAEIRTAYAEYGVGLAVVSVAVVGTWLLAGRWWGIGALTVLVAALLFWYERRYATAARRIRERLS